MPAIVKKEYNCFLFNKLIIFKKYEGISCKYNLCDELNWNFCLYTVANNINRYCSKKDSLIFMSKSLYILFY